MSDSLIQPTKAQQQAEHDRRITRAQPLLDAYAALKARSAPRIILVTRWDGTREILPIEPTAEEKEFVRLMGEMLALPELAP